ncbi:MAG: hypothetical protein N3B13_00255 [Deltaproteobacteria bacterium]|nr:hypothetical protein [Deltaproteobacteria bacterium]
MSRFLFISGSLFLVLLAAGCASGATKEKSDSPVVNIKKVTVENVPVFKTPEQLSEFIKTTPEYREAVLLANELLGDAEVRKRLENYGYSPFVSGDLDGDGKDEFASVIINRKIPELIIIKKNVQEEWKEQFSMKLNSYAWIKLSEPSLGIFGSPCVIVANISLKAVSNVCWDGMKYLSVDY